MGVRIRGKAEYASTLTANSRAIMFQENHCLAYGGASLSQIETNPLGALRKEFLDAQSYASRQEVIERFCDVLPIDFAEEIGSGQLLLAISDGKQHLLIAGSPALRGDELWVSSAMDGSSLKPLPIEKVTLSIQRSKLHRLVLRGDATESPLQESPKDPNEYQSSVSIQERDQLLDAGAFSQLVDAAQRSGIVPGVGIIIQVRDCEFRLGKYHLALQLIESMLSSFVGSATQRLQRLKREEQDIASGRVKMSPKDLQAKRARDNRGTELVERARMKFMRVLEGIRAIIQLENEKEKKF